VCEEGDRHRRDDNDDIPEVVSGDCEGLSRHNGGVADAVTLSTAPDPQILCPIAKAGNAMLVAGIAFFGVIAVSFVIAMIVDPSRRTEPFAPISFFTSAAAVAFFAVTAKGLRRRRRWALTALIATVALAAVAALGTAISIIVHPPGPPNTDGAGYDLMGAVVWFGLFAVFLFHLAKRSTRNTYRPAPAAWYPDPTLESHWRWWNGEAWTTYSG
jgi:predicted membrane metal-binding protein